MIYYNIQCYAMLYYAVGCSAAPARRRDAPTLTPMALVRFGSVPGIWKY